MLEMLKFCVVPNIMSNWHFVLVLAFAALTNCGRSEVISAQEQFDITNTFLKGVVVHDPSAIIGNEEKHFKTPWMIVSPDAQKGFTNGFTTNAISVVSEDGVNYYAHQQDENGGRTNVIHFTVNKDGIPSRTGEVIDTTKSGEANNAENMKKRKLIGVSQGTLYFYPCEEYGTSLVYNPVTGAVIKDEEVLNWQTFDWEPQQQKCLATYSAGYLLNALINRQEIDFDGSIKIRTERRVANGSMLEVYKTWGDTAAFVDDRNNMTLPSIFSGYMYTGDSNGTVYADATSVATLPGAISGLSNNGDEVFATTKATNAFYNVTLGKYNVVKDENGDPKPMVPKTHDGLVKVIDNRKNGGKFLYVTSKGVYSIDD